MNRVSAFALAVVLASTTAAAHLEDASDPMSSGTFTGLAFRSIGPALTSGRIVDIAVHPRNPKIYYVAAASGGVWKTENAGTTWTPIFDDQPSYSIGTITLDPNDPLVVWVGTGENNSQRSVAWGDGVYKSTDGGKSFKNVGLRTSEHIARIVVDPRDSKTVYVASQGPLWNAGGERGLYKTEDGGASWRAVFTVSENTGVTEVLMDPRNPDVLVAASYQRRRHVFTLIGGGPESAIYKSIDGGATWEKKTAGLPTGDMGRIGLTRSPANADVLYAIIEASEKDQGFYRSKDGGESWEKRSDYVSGGPMYYNEIIADVSNPDRVYSMDTWMMVTVDGGKTFSKVGETFKHVDNHALWIDPEDAEHLLAGCDGGLYQSFDRGATWDFTANLPITQFYRVSVDDAFPFYNVYGGTQDNFSLGGPSRTPTGHGILNSDWFVTQGGDGFETVVDPEDPNILYAQSQHGGLVRFDRKSGEAIAIQPQPEPGEALKWNWDSPLIVSPHSHTRLYFAANRLFRSDDRGNSWRPVSPDLTAGIDRNALPVMGKVWSVDAVAKNQSTSFYGNIVSLSESALKEGLLYVGTDDGLVQVTDDAGASWARTEIPRGVPERTYVSRIEASSHDVDTLYAAFENHKMGDFRPYVFKSADRGGNWTSIASNLPENGPVYALVEDYVNPRLLFAGTEFGIFFTVDGGGTWVQLKGGVPTIAVRDLAIQRRENDLVLGTFGRGFFILDDYSPLRTVSAETLGEEAVLFPLKRSWMYMESFPLGLRGKSFQGDSFYAADNPPFGAVVTYYLKDELRTKKKARQEEEKRIEGEGGSLRYPSWDQLRAEDREEEPAIVITVKDAAGDVVRRLEGPVTKGFHRVAWDFRFPDSRPTRLQEPALDNPFASPPMGPMVVPGTYEVSLAKRVDGALTPLGEPQKMEAEALGTASLPAEDKLALLKFQQETASLQRAALGALRAVEDTKARLEHIRKAILQSPGAEPSLLAETRGLVDDLLAIDVALSGDATIRSRSEPTPPGLLERVEDVVSGHWTSTSAPTEVQRQAYEIAGSELEPVLERLGRLLENDLRALEEKLDAAGAPWTPGRTPRWKRP